MTYSLDWMRMKKESEIRNTRKQAELINAKELAEQDFKKIHRIEELKNEIFRIENHIPSEDSGFTGVRETDELDTGLAYANSDEIDLNYVLTELNEAQKDFEEKLDFIEEKLKFVTRDSNSAGGQKYPRHEVHPNELLNLIANIANKYRLYSHRLVNLRNKLIF